MAINNIKVHFTHKARIRKLYAGGYSDEELAIMYKTTWSTIKNVTRGVQRPERI